MRARGIDRLLTSEIAQILWNKLGFHPSHIVSLPRSAGVGGALAQTPAPSAIAVWALGYRL